MLVKSNLKRISSNLKISQPKISEKFVVQFPMHGYFVFLSVSRKFTKTFVKYSFSLGTEKYFKREFKIIFLTFWENFQNFTF